MDNPRKVALDALLKVNFGDGFSNIVLNSTLKKAELSTMDTGLVSSIFYGVLERKITLDTCIASFLESTKKLSNVVAEILRIGAYQILFMDKIPDRAAVNESVQLVKNSKEYRSAGLVNAVLRNIAREKTSLLDMQEDSKEQISIKYSAPGWLVGNLIADYGKENTVEFLKVSLKPSPFYIKVNTTKISRDELKKRFAQQGIYTENTILETALRLDKPGNIEKNTLFQEGLFFTEDLASQICVEILAPQEGERILDLCAAPGGKSFACAIRMKDRGQIVSCDLHEHRCRLIESGKQRLGLSSIHPLQNDATQKVPEGTFDKVLCDVPCSGIGIIRRKPDIKYKKPDDLKELPPLALAILEQGASAVKNGGRLVYSTCTLRKSENQKVVDKFLQAHSQFEQEPIHVEGISSVINDGTLTLMPQFGDTDGFFVASFIKRKDS